MKYICVYLGAHFGHNQKLQIAVKTLGESIAEQGLTLVYGGSSMGLMGLLAKTVKDNGGSVIGIIAKSLIDKEVPLTNLDELIIVDTMQERKKLMQLRSDAFVVMPGGLGTLEEAIETWNAVKIGEINKPVIFYNQDNYFKHLFEFAANCSEAGYLNPEHLNIPHISENIAEVMSHFSMLCE